MRRTIIKSKAKDKRIFNLVYKGLLSQREGAKLLDVNRETFRKLYNTYKDIEIENELF